MEKDLYQKEEGMEVDENMKRIVKENFNRWNNALLTGDAEAVANLYSKKSTFLPTVSSEFKKGAKEAEDYFKHFLEKNPSGKIVSEAIQPIASNAYLHSGTYDFEVGPEDNRTIVEARFTFLWQKSYSGGWKIAHHHSSVKPQP